MRERHKRIQELKFTNIMQREQKEDQNLKFIKKQSEIILNAKREVSVQSRIETERIYNSL